MIEELNPPRLSDGELSHTDEILVAWRDRPELIQSIIDKIEAEKPIRASSTLIMDQVKRIIWEERKARGVGPRTWYGRYEWPFMGLETLFR